MAEEGEGRGRLEEALAARRAKLDRLRERGIEPFALKFDPDHSLSELKREFGELPPGSSSGKRVRVAGRIMLRRGHGGLTFATIRDAAADLQLFLSKDALGPEGYALVDDLDLGDIVGAEGEVITTKRGELSVKADRVVLLTKALRPMPEKWHGLRDQDAQQRQRYLHLMTDLEARRSVTARAA